MRDHDTYATRRLMEVSEGGTAVGITSVIYQEVLQGAASPVKFGYIADHLGSQTFYSPLHTKTSYKEASRMYFACRRQGITIRSSIDCLIARVAIEHDLLLLHDDRDFEALAGIIPELALA